MTSAISRIVRAFSGLALLGSLAACSIHADPDFPPPIEPLAAEARTPIVVAPFENASPSPEVAQWSYSTRRFLEALLDRSRRFTVLPSATPGVRTLHVRFVDVRDEPYLESVVFAGEQRTGVKRRAMVAIEWNLEGAGGTPSQLVADHLVESADPLELPTADQLESGSFWESPFGTATREALDHLVRDLSERTTSGARR